MLSVCDRTKVKILCLRGLTEHIGGSRMAFVLKDGSIGGTQGIEAGRLLLSTLLSLTLDLSKSSNKTAAQKTVGTENVVSSLKTQIACTGLTT